MAESKPSVIHVPQVRRAASRWLVLGVVSLGALISTLDTSTVTIALPALSRAFNVDSSTVLWASMGYLLVSAGLLFTSGWLGGALGRRTVYLFGLLFYAVGLGLASVAPTFTLLLLARLFQGIGSAAILGNDHAIIAGVFAARERGWALGLRGAAVGVGLAGGPFVGGILLDLLDWRALFYTRIPLCLITMALGWKVLAEQRDARRRQGRPDILGAVTLFGGVGGFLLAVNQAGRVGLDSPLVWYGALAAAVLLPVFFVLERRAGDPILDLTLFRLRPFTLALASLALHFVAWGGVGFLAPFYLIQGLGYSATMAGLVLTTFPATRLVLAPLSGLIADRMGPRLPTALGLALLGAGLLALGSLGDDPSLALLIAALMVSGIGSAFFEPAASGAILGAVPRDRVGTASASVPMGRQMAMSCGLALAGAVLSVRATVYRQEALGVGVTPEQATMAGVVGGFGDTILVGALFALLGAIVAFVNVGVRKPDRTEG